MIYSCTITNKFLSEKCQDLVKIGLISVPFVSRTLKTCKVQHLKFIFVLFPVFNPLKRFTRFYTRLCEFKLDSLKKLLF